VDALTAWKSIPRLAQDALARAGAEALDAPDHNGGMTLREVVHHVVEANVVAASIVVAAMGSPGCTYDWSWMLPFGAWMDRMDYRRKPIEPALALLEALNAYVAAQIEPLAGALAREVQLKDSADAALRRVTVAEVLIQEADHARDHLTLGAARE
jgi:hypothetical protein